jgi:gas vesicle protein/uncharacterized protein (DUF697 family)
MQLGEAMRQSGTLTKQQMFAFDDARRSEMRTMADEAKTRGGVINTIGNFGDTVQQKLVVGVLDAAGQTKNLRETIAEQDKELKNATKNQKEALDPAAMQRMQQTIAETSNKMTVLLAENLPKLSSAFDQLMKIINDYVVPAFRFLMDHFGAIVGTVVAFKGALALASAAAKAFELYKNVAGPGTNPAKPMWVKDVSGGGVGGGGDLGGGKGKGKVPGKGIGKMAKGFGAVGAVISAGMLVSDLSDIDEQEKAGNITSGESKEAKGGAVGSAVGGAGGAWAGAAAGAAIGSVVPVVGTVIGGAIGAALGGWLGSNAGEIAGKELTKAVVAAPKEGSQDWLKVNDKNINSWVDAVHEGRVKMEQVPGVYMPYVKERIAKKPVKATATSATEAAKPATAGGVNYKAGAEDLLKQFVAANGSVPAQLKDQRAVSNVNDAQKSLAAEAEKKAQAEKEKAEAEKKALEEKSKKPSTTQESSETLLASLNTNMGQLVKLMKDQNSLSENQLSATKSLTGDLFASVG